MGIDPTDPDYNCHHVLFRSDFKENPNWNEDYQDSKANLFPLPVEDHERLHGRIEERESRVLYQAPKRERKPKYRLHDLGRLWQERG